MKVIDKIKKGYNKVCDKTADALQNVTRDQIETVFGAASGLASICVSVVVSNIVGYTSPTNGKKSNTVINALGSMFISSVIATATSKEIMQNGEDFIKVLEDAGYIEKEEEKDERDQSAE